MGVVDAASHVCRHLIVVEPVDDVGRTEARVFDRIALVVDFDRAASDPCRVHREQEVAVTVDVAPVDHVLPHSLRAVEDQRPRPATEIE